MTSRGGGRLGEFAVCIRNDEYEVDLIGGKIYRVVKPKRNDRPSDIRIIDESGEDYLYPREWFVVSEESLRRDPLTRRISQRIP